MSGRDGSSQWSSPPLSHTSDILTYTSDDATSLSLAPHHNVMIPSQASSGFCDNDSDVTASTRKLSPYSIGVGTLSSENSQYSHRGLDIPPVFSSSRLPRSASIVDAQEHSEREEVLAGMRSARRRTKHPDKNPYSSLSQETYEYYRNQPHFTAAMSLSQSSHPPRFPHTDGMYYHKPGSPASSSDTSSLSSSVANRLGSQSVSTVSVLTSSSTASNPIRLPRPSPLSGSSGGGHLPVRPPKSILPVPEYASLTQHSDVPPLSQYSSCKDYEGDEAISMPILPSMKQRAADQPSSQHRRSRGQKVVLGARMPPEGQTRDRVVLRDRHDLQSKQRRSKPGQPRILEEGNPRDSYHTKLDMVLSVLQIVSGSKDQSDIERVTILLALSESPPTCSVLRQSACINMLIQIMHNLSNKGDNTHREVRTKAARAMRNIVESTADSWQRKCEVGILSVLERLRSHSGMIFDFIYSHPANRKIDSAEAETLQNACEAFMQTIRKLYKLSTDKENCRRAILSLGGLQATAEILIVNYKLMASQKSSRSSNDKVISHSAKTITVVISILINLTYGAANNKSLLCNIPEFLEALMYHLHQRDEIVISSGAQVLRNLSWRASEGVKKALFMCDASVTLVAALDCVEEETTIQHITSALWNLSAHSVDNREKICSTHSGIRQLVELLSFHSPSGTTAVVENVGGILKNLSVVLMRESNYRRRFREFGGLAKLVQHLKSKNKTVLANATGVLWNLSARNHEDQRLLWDLGCIPLLDVLQTSRHKSIAEGARGALRNLLAYGQSNSKSDVATGHVKMRGLSKSVSSANYAYNHNASQPVGGRHGNEALHMRHAHPHPKNKTSSINSLLLVSEARGSSSRSDAGYGYRDGGELSGEHDGYSTSQQQQQQHKSKLKFSRVGSAPQPQPLMNGEEEDEWESYMPNHVKQSSSSSSQQQQQAKPYPDEPPRRKKAPKLPRPRGQSIPMTFSQTEPYPLSPNSEMHSVGGASYGFSPHLSDGGVSLSVIGTDIDGKLENFDHTAGAATGPQEEYADLDLEVEEDESDVAMHHPPVEGGYSVADNFARVQNTVRRGYGYGLDSRSHVGGQSPSRGGTSNLALDGTGESMDVSGMRADSEELRRSWSQGSKKVITDV